MAYQDEKFILKEFIVGLLVILVVLTFLLSGIRKLTTVLNLSNLFSKKTIITQQQDNNCRDLPVYDAISQGQSIEYDREFRRRGLTENLMRYSLKYFEVASDKIGIELTSDDPKIDSFQNHYFCDTDGIKAADYDPLLLAALTNSMPDKLNGEITYALDGGNFTIFSKSENGVPSEKSIDIKGVKDGKYCLQLQAKGMTVNNGQEKISLGESEINSYKITNSWQATVSASLAVARTSQECVTFEGNYETQATLDVIDVVWYADFGMVKRNIAAQNLKGNYYFLPSGGLPVEITDEVVR